MGGKDLNFYVAPQAPFTNKNAFEEQKNVWKGPIACGHVEKYSKVLVREGYPPRT